MTLHAQADVLTMALFRGIIGVPLLFLWLMVGATPKPLTTPARHLSLFIGVLFAGNVFFLFKAIEAMEVPLAILTYFTYPLLTGLAAAAFGVERLGLAGLAAALAAFAGLALMIGAHPGGVALMGIAFALMSSSTRVVILLLTRAKLMGADSRLITLWSLIAATAVFVIAALVTANWQPPVTGGRLVCADRLEHRDVDRGADDLHLDRQHRPVPHGAVHEPRAAARDHRERDRAQRGDHAACRRLVAR